MSPAWPALSQLPALRRPVLISAGRAVHLSTGRGQHEISVQKLLWPEGPWNPEEEENPGGWKNEPRPGGRERGHVTHAPFHKCFRVGLGWPPKINSAQAGPSATAGWWGQGKRGRYRKPEEQGLQQSE